MPWYFSLLASAVMALTNHELPLNSSTTKLHPNTHREDPLGLKRVYCTNSEGLTAGPVSWCGWGLGQTTLVPVAFDVGIKESEPLAAQLRLKHGHDLLVHKDGEDGGLKERRVESLGVEGLVGEVSGLVKVLELLPVLLPLLVVLFGHDDELLVVGEVLHKVVCHDLPHVRREPNLGLVGGVVPLAGLVGVVLIIEVVGTFVDGESWGFEISPAGNSRFSMQWMVLGRWLTFV